MLLQEGFPSGDFAPPPFIQSDYQNGQGINYRPLDANERPRSQQWNLTVDREIAKGFSVSAAYVGNHSTHLPSNNDPLNALNPSLLSLGNQLYDEFQPGQTSLHGVPEPYPGWREQMTGCAPSLAQALLPYPQYCGNLQGENENHGTSTYHSLQAKVEKRFSGGTYFLLSYTWSKIMTSGTDNIQRDALTWSAASGVISPYEQDRNRSLATDDVTHVLSAALVYDIPVGKGRKYMDKGGLTNAILGGWQLSTVFRYSTGIPFYFRSSFCNVPGQFRAACIPSVNGGANVFAQDLGSFDPGEGTALRQERLPVHRRLQLQLRDGSAGDELPRLRLPQPGPLPDQEHEPGRQHQPAVAHRGLQPLELAHVQQLPGNVGGQRLHHRHREPRLRQVERERDEPAERPGRDPLRVLADGSAPTARPAGTNVPNRPGLFLS